MPNEPTKGAASRAYASSSENQERSTTLPAPPRIASAFGEDLVRVPPHPTVLPTGYSQFLRGLRFYLLSDRFPGNARKIVANRGAGCDYVLWDWHDPGGHPERSEEPVLSLPKESRPPKGRFLSLAAQILHSAALRSEPALREVEEMTSGAHELIRIRISPHENQAHTRRRMQEPSESTTSDLHKKTPKHELSRLGVSCILAGTAGSSPRPTIVRFETLTACRTAWSGRPARQSRHPTGLDRRD